MTSMPRNPRRLLLNTTLVVAVAAVPLGCYKRVVGTKNAPGYTGLVYESNLGEGDQDGNETLFQVEKRTFKGTYFVD